MEISNWSAPFGCEPSSIPFTYLGIPDGENMNKKNAWRLIIEKFHSKLSTWKVKALSFGGRVTLANAVLGNLPTYFMSIFVIPNGVLDTLEKIRRKFIWCREYNKKSIYWVKWDKIIAPKKVGGIGLGSIKATNISLLAKWMWRLKADESSMWSKVIRSIHNLEGRHWCVFANRSNTGVWKNIIKTRNRYMQYNIDPKEIVSWNSIDRCWESDIVRDGRFMVCLLRERIELAGYIVNDGPFAWDKLTPFKILCFIWRAKLGRIPSAVELKNRGIIIPNTMCGVCNSEEETCEHILLTCPVAKEIMDSILVWCEIRCDRFLSVDNMLLFISRWSKCKYKRRLLNAILCGALWFIWMDRNKRIFEKIPIVSANTWKE
ncbi:uncharacterized protein LOC128132828 [Lactuca sativa]|uniref:uncharacterized protein LOC128132828 n=1 Tax=Lactuca sativa TaxID=4236 RepID=UPI0022B058FF|nr:uncharacterized protein LOC128132828 [Lactuca sativa]